MGIVRILSISVLVDTFINSTLHYLMQKIKTWCAKIFGVTEDKGCGRLRSKEAARHWNENNLVHLKDQPTLSEPVSELSFLGAHPCQQHSKHRIMTWVLRSGYSPSTAWMEQRHCTSLLRSRAQIHTSQTTAPPRSSSLQCLIMSECDQSELMLHKYWQQYRLSRSLSLHRCQPIRNGYQFSTGSQYPSLIIL